MIQAIENNGKSKRLQANVLLLHRVTTDRISQSDDILRCVIDLSVLNINLAFPWWAER